MDGHFRELEAVEVESVAAEEGSDLEMADLVGGQVELDDAGDSAACGDEVRIIGDAARSVFCDGGDLVLRATTDGASRDVDEIKGCHAERGICVVPLDPFNPSDRELSRIGRRIGGSALCGMRCQGKGVCC